MLGRPTLVTAIEKIAEPSLAKRALAALDQFLQGVYLSAWPEVAWEFSNLTGDGFPVEFTFSSSDDLIRYTTEVGGPEANSISRLSLAEKALASLDVVNLSPHLEDILRRIQATGPLRFGAWVGGRHGASGDDFKIYIEVPRPNSQICKNILRELLAEGPIISRSELQIIGYGPMRSSIELYFRIEDFEPWEIGLLLDQAGIHHRLPKLCSLLEDAYGRPVDSALTGTVGYSYSFSSSKGPMTVSLFKYARSVFGGDGGIRRGMLGLAARNGWNLRSYAAISEPLAKGTGGRTFHGMMAFIVPPEGPLAVSIGLRPPEQGYDAR